VTARIALFAIPKAFSGHTGVIQNNALDSWSRLDNTQIVLLGTDPGVAEAAERVGAVHIPDIATNDLGTPLISDAFKQLRARWRDSILLYVNADMILTPALIAATDALQALAPREWMMVGRRVDCDVTERLDLSGDWAARVASIAGRGTLHGPSGMDYFACSPAMPVSLPEMAVGRPGWDSWFVFEALRRRVAVVDATGAVLALHQNHPPAYSSTGTEAHRNLQAAGGLFNVATIRQSNYRLGVDGKLSANPVGRVLFSYPARWAMGIYRLLRSRLAR
jgi:hypothetical protein